MEDKDMARVELKEQDLEQVVGGNFYWYKENGQRYCTVEGIGTFKCNAEAQDEFIDLAMEYRYDTSKTVQDYVNMLLAGGYFY